MLSPVQRAKIALKFAKAGYDVGLIARDEASLHSTQEELRRFGVNVAFPTPAVPPVITMTAIEPPREFSRYCRPTMLSPGYDVGLIARDEASLHSTQEELRRFGVNAHAVQAAPWLFPRPPSRR
jgi:hypothetical protein